ncbi:MAG TPA: hydroxymethylbilane synthase [Candidatus Dormibacteraeota bacterium]|jgi:hydroxymethylbilane synthase|nr:hydroxymethylbilane synthase [Candidatus Dormibacteraeota bacterium]
MPKLRIGSRGSQLALWQANHISALLRERSHEVEIEIIYTTGDKITDVALAMVGTKGMFTKEIEEALAAGRIDLAVHSLKDLPTELPPGFEIAAITERQDPRDAFCSRSFSSFQELPQGARVGTSSLRRQAQLKAIRPDLDIHPLRGNVDTRLRKLEQGEYDAIILASAGLKRLDKTELIKQIIPAEIMYPAAGQGALGIEIREGDAVTREHLEFLNDPAACAATTCERALLNRLGGGCQVPIGAFAEIRLSGNHRAGSGKDREGHDFSRADYSLEKKTALAAGVLHLEAIVADPDGSKLLRESRDGNLDDPAQLGNEVGDILLRRGGDEILEAVYGRGLAVPPQP